MLLPVSKLTPGLVAVVATAITSKCTGNACLHAASKTLASASPPAPTVEAAAGTVLSFSRDALLNIRGGAATSAMIDFSRESLALQGMATYGTITALILNASLRLFTSTKFHIKQNRMVRNAFYISIVLCIMSGAFTAILFQLMTIYSKSALGISNDEGYLAFKAATGTFRRIGFQCFLMEMIAFVVSFVVHLYNALWTNARELEKAKGGEPKTKLTRIGKGIFGGSLLLILAGVYGIHKVLTLATQHVYS